MPKKTKKEKLLALYHKKLSLLENRTTVSPVKSSAKPVPTQSSPKKQVISADDSKTEEKQLNKFFISDLKKSLILIAVIIGIELSMYAMHFVK